ncbi:MAG: hypothetical protein E7262_00520 [Lachnospiraceae bacterium]|nr:hypothetical protein [Lachnospiraceae bacterium]
MIDKTNDKENNVDKDKVDKYGNVKNKEFFIESIRILHNAYLEKKLVLFVGAGADKDSGIPLWGKAIEKFEEHLEIENNTEDMLRIPQYYYNARGKKEYVELCKNIFCYDKKLNVNDLHRRIIDLNVGTIVTTNYSDLLGQEMKNRGIIYENICEDKNLAYNRSQNIIIKMHGDFQHDNFVLKEDDYLNYFRNFRLIETYIKSLFATNVVLFIGYSFSDPDLKQIFSWIKDILGEDMQHAYLLEGFGEYDKNKFEYYKNLGVNVIYTKGYMENDKESLLKVLELIKEGNKKQMLPLEIANAYLTPFSKLNYVMTKYINRGLRKCNLDLYYGEIRRITSGKLDDDNKNKNIIKYLCEEDIDDEVQNDNIYDNIANVIKKSAANKVELYEKYTGTKDIVKQLNTTIVDKILEFDFLSLKNQIDNDGIEEYKEDTYEGLEKAYIYYLIGEYQIAYKYLNSVAKDAYYKSNNYMYYIAQYNKCRLKEIVANNYIVSKDIRNKISEEASKIDLEYIINNMPTTTYDNIDMLKEIGSFQLQHVLFQDLFKIAKKVKIEQDTLYNIYSGIPSYKKMRYFVKDYFKFITYNYFFVDGYVESKEIYKLYIESIVQSSCAKDIVNKEPLSFLEEAHNIHATHIGKFEIFLIIKYMSYKEIKGLVEKVNVKNIPIDEECKNYIKVVVKNLQTKQVNNEEIFWNCIALLPYIEFDIEDVENVLDGITERLDSITYRIHNKEIQALFRCICEKKIYKKADGEFNINNYALGRLMSKTLEIIYNCDDAYSIRELGELLCSIMYMTNTFYKAVYNDDIKRLLREKYSLIVSKIYSYCDSSNKRKIKRFFKEWKGDSSWRSIELYYYLVSKGIVEPSSEYEIIIYDRIQKHDEQKPFGFEERNILITLFNLKVSDKLALADDFMRLIQKFKDDEIYFLNDMENYDYSNFKLEWLGLYGQELIKKISNNLIAKKHIQKIYVEQVNNGNINENLIKMYFKYFV